jgi:hypothetical protein
MRKFRHIQKSTDLPEEWNKLAHNYFQKTKFLNYSEKYNPCQQRYYLCYEDGDILSAAIVYSLQLDLFTFTFIRKSFKMNIVGIPCSVTSQGIFGESASMEDLKNHIYKVEKGLVLILNLEERPTEGSNAIGNTLPSILFSNQYLDWDDYQSSLRSDYRRRLKRIYQANKSLRFEKKSCSAFTIEMHKQYLNVYKHSSSKLEKLSFDFFKNLPKEFILRVCLYNETIVGWNIAIQNQNINYFFLGGINYEQNKQYQIYLGLLSKLIEDGIACKSEIIDLGQTAEIPKMRMGGKPKALFMEAHHNNWVLNKLLKLCSPFLEYQRKFGNTNVIKKKYA